MTDTQNIITFYVTIAGLAATLIGFSITIYNVRKTRRLSQQIRKDIRRVDTVAEFSTFIAGISELKILQRKGAWEILPDKYSSLRKTLISIKELNPDMKDEHKKIMQSAISNLNALESEIEASNCNMTSPPEASSLNKTLSKQVDKLQPIFIQIKNQIGR